MPFDNLPVMDTIAITIAMGDCIWHRAQVTARFRSPFGF
jgi:hypothetical protein